VGFIVQCAVDGSVEPALGEIGFDAQIQGPRTRVFIEPNAEFFQFFLGEGSDCALNFLNFLSGHILYSLRERCAAVSDYSTFNKGLRLWEGREIR